MLLNCGVGEDTWESLGLQGDPARPSWRKSVLNIHWKDLYRSWNSNSLATWWEELTHLKRLWFWERLKAAEGDERGWDGWMASVTQWTWVWVNSGSWWWTGGPGMLQSPLHAEVAKSRTRRWLNWTDCMYGCGKDCLILIPFRLPQITCFTLKLKCFSPDSDNCLLWGSDPCFSSPTSWG